jgi:hypothetical protein
LLTPGFAAAGVPCDPFGRRREGGGGRPSHHPGSEAPRGRRSFVELWKVAGERRFDVDSHDEILLTLPIMVGMGRYVHVDVKAVRRYEDFAGSVNRLLLG